MHKYGGFELSNLCGTLSGVSQAPPPPTVQYGMKS